MPWRFKGAKYLRGKFPRDFVTLLLGNCFAYFLSCGSSEHNNNFPLNSTPQNDDATATVSDKASDSSQVDQSESDAEVKEESASPNAETNGIPASPEGETIPLPSPLPSPEVLPAPKIPKWYTRNGKIFSPEDKEWRGVGTNLSNLMGKSREYISQRIEQEARMGFNFIRLWTPNHNSTGPVVMNDRANQVAEIMDIIHSYNMQVMLVFWDTYMDLWGNPFRYFRDPEWFKSGYQGDFLDWVKIIVPKIKDHPALFMYQLINESSCREACADDYINMYLDTSKYIRSIDPVHLISPGGLSLTHAIEKGSYQGNITNFVEALLKADDQLVWTDSLYNLEQPNIRDPAAVKDKIATIVTEYGFCESTSFAPPLQQMNDPEYGAKALFEKWHVSGIAAWEAGETDCGYANPRYAEFNLTEAFKALAYEINR